MSLSGIRAWAAVKRDAKALWIAARDPRVPWYQVACRGRRGYTRSAPIDFVPDFIPVRRYLDDVLIVPVGMLVAIKLIPRKLKPSTMRAFFRESTAHSRVND